MTSTSQVTYQALRDYLNGLLYPSLADQALADVPAALRPGLEAFMAGKTEYQPWTWPCDGPMSSSSPVPRCCASWRRP